MRVERPFYHEAAAGVFAGRGGSRSAAAAVAVVGEKANGRFALETAVFQEAQLGLCWGWGRIFCAFF